jgi:hypothetical protein
MIRVTFLAAASGAVMSKRFCIENGTVALKDPYPFVKRFTSHEVEVHSIKDFYSAILKHANKGNCLLKGNLDRPITRESRAGHTRSHETTQWVVLDNDHLHDVEPQELMDLLGLGYVNYVTQYSASAGIVDGKMGYHIFFLLDESYHPAALKLYLKHLNLSIPDLREKLSLTRTNMSLRWPIDITVCQNDKIIYIAPPVCGPGVTDTLKGNRIQLIERS